MTAAEDVAELVERIRAAYPLTEGREGFLSDPGGWIAYLGLTDDDDIAAAATGELATEALAEGRAHALAHGEALGSYEPHADGCPFGDGTGTVCTCTS